MMRKVFGPAVVGVIIGAIALVFVFYGVYNPRTNGRTGGGGAWAAKVNGEVISGQEYEREVRSRAEYFEQMFKGKADPDLLKKLGIRKQVLEELVSRKLVSQAADKMGFAVADAEVREKITEMPYFKKKDAAGVEHFDPATYKQVLEANRRSPTEFEELVRQDALRSKVMEYLQNVARVSETEVKHEFETSENRRTVEYVFIEKDKLKDRLVVPAKGIDDFMAKKENEAQIKSYYESMKYQYRKAEPKTAKKDDKKTPPKAPEFLPLEEVKRRVVTDMLRDRRSSELTKMSKDLADEIFAKAKSGDVKSFAKSKGLEAKTTDKFNQTQEYLQGIGPVAELIDDAFRADSTLAKEAKLYTSGANYVIAYGLKSFVPVAADFTKKKEELSKSLKTRKSQQAYEGWMEDLKKKADIEFAKTIDRVSDEG